MAATDPAVRQSVIGLTGAEGKYLTFSLADEHYGIGVRKIKEIIGMMPVTSIPRTPVYVKGVINLRGKVIPVFDLRLKFGMGQAECTERTCIIVVEVRGSAASQLMGIVVNSVSEVVSIKGEDIEETPDLGEEVDSHYILGMAKISGDVKILLDIDKVLNAGEIDPMSGGS